MSGYPPEVPGVTATGVQRALGERRRRRMAERGGHVDLDATMSSWPTPDPPTRPRPVVRPRRALPGGGDRPVLPTPSALVMAELAAHAPPPSAGETSEGSRRSRRGGTGVIAPVRPSPVVEAPRERAGGTGPVTRVRPGAGSDPFSRGAGRSAAPASEPFTRVPPPERPPPGGTRQDRMSGPALGPAAVAAGATRARRRTPPSPAAPFGTGPQVLPAAPGTVPGVRHPSERAEEMLAQPRGLGGRRRLVWIVAAVLAALALIAVAVFAIRGRAPLQAALLPANDAPRQDTALVSVLADDGTIAQSALLALDEDSLISVAAPGSLTLDVADVGEITLAQSVKEDPGAPVRGVEDTLGVRVDGSWVVDRGVLRDLIDASGGIVMDVAAQIVAGDVTIPAGPAQRLTGAQAGVYALATVEGETPDVAVARFNQVILGLLAVMPREPDRVTQLISATERNTATTITSEQLSALLAGASQRIADNVAVPAAVPLVVLPDGGQATVVDVAGMQQLVAGDLAGAELRVATVGPLRAAVQNAVGTDGLVTKARDLLVAGGFRYTGGGEDGTGAAESVVLVPSDTPENRTRGEAVAAALGLDADSLAVLPPEQVTDEVDVIVVLGQDFATLTGSGTT